MKFPRQSFSKSSEIMAALLVVGAIGFAAWQMQYFAVFTVDDAYISYRYAENFANGQGLVFNPGEYVEGYTNFLWVLLLGVLKKLGSDVHRSSQVLGGLFSFLALGLTYLLSTTLAGTFGGSRQSAHFAHVFEMTALVAVATSPAFGVWAVAGLETPLVMCLLTGAIWCAVREENTPGFPYSAVWFGLLTLTRPEGLLYFGLTVFAKGCFRCKRLHWRLPRRWSPSPLDLWRPLIIFLGVALPHFWWRWYYYASIFPNTYYAKVGREFYLAGVKYVYEFLGNYGGLSLVVICSLLLLANRWREYWVGYVLLLLGVSTVYFMAVGGDWMPEYRFFAPLLPIFFLCLQEGIREFGRLLGKTDGRWAAMGVSLLVVLVCGNNLYRLYKTPRIETRWDGHVEIGQFLRTHAKPHDVLAAIDIGAMAYFSGLRTIDCFGLTDRHIARLKPQTYTFQPGFWGRQAFRLKADPEYILAQKPTFIELNTTNSPEQTEQASPADPYSDLMFRNVRFKAAYIPWYHVNGTTIFMKKGNP